MKQVKNVSVGVLISFLGSIPLGYLNLAGFEIYNKFGLNHLFLFLLGIVFVETLVVYFTLLFANQFVNNKSLMKAIDIFSIIFMIALAYEFYMYTTATLKSNSYLVKYFMYSPFVIGVFLNCINFFQLPFRTSWNLYLTNGKHITIEKNFRYYYIAGTSIGVFLGMFSVILLLQFIFKNSFLSNYLTSIIPLFFLVLAGIQIVKVYNKYFHY